MDEENNIVSLDEWKRIQRRLERMTLPELAMITHRLIDLMVDLASHVEELKEQVETEFR